MKYKYKIYQKDKYIVLKQKDQDTFKQKLMRIGKQSVEIVLQKVVVLKNELIKNDVQ